MSAGWRDCPFVKGKVYAITRDAKAFRDTFNAGERLTFVDAAFSVYHGMTGYFFKDEKGRDRAFDVSDDETGDEWQTLFARLDGGE
jgi:hypothetical protein